MGDDCQQCRFYRKTKLGTQEYTQCRRRAPVVIGIASDYAETIFPEPIGPCGEFEPAPEAS